MYTLVHVEHSRSAAGANDAPQRQAREEGDGCRLVVTLAQILSLAILARAVLSWFPTSRTLLPVVDVLNTITDPVLVPIRRWMPAVGGLDLSPLLAIFLVGVMESLLLGMLAGH